MSAQFGRAPFNSPGGGGDSGGGGKRRMKIPTDKVVVVCSEDTEWLLQAIAAIVKKANFGNELKNLVTKNGEIIAEVKRVRAIRDYIAQQYLNDCAFMASTRIERASNGVRAFAALIRLAHDAGGAVFDQVVATIVKELTDRYEDDESDSLPDMSRRS